MVTIFEEYLKEQHAKQYRGLDDEMSDDYDDWFINLDRAKIVEYANALIKTL